MQQPLKPTSAQSRHTAIRSSGENPLSSTGFSFHAHDVLNPSIFERGQLISPKQTPGINVVAAERPRPLNNTVTGSEGFSKLFTNQTVRQPPRKKNISARIMRRFPVPLSPQNLDPAMVEAGGGTPPTVRALESVIREKPTRKQRPSPPKPRESPMPLESQFFGLKDNREHMINNSHLLGELKELIHRKRENKAKSMDKALARNQLFSQTVTPGRARRPFDSSEGSTSPRAALLEDLNFEIRAWRKVNPKSLGTRAILLGKEDDCLKKGEPITPIMEPRGSSPIGRIPLPQILRKATTGGAGGVGVHETPARHHSMGIEGGESIFSVTTDGRVSVLQAVGYHTADDDQVSVMAQVLKASINDNERREELAREIIGPLRGAVDHDAMQAAGELHFWLMEKMTRLKDLRMQLGMNFDLIKAVNSQQRGGADTPLSRGSPHKGLQESPISLDGLKIMLNEKTKQFIQMNATELNQHLRKHMGRELTELCKVFRMAMRTIYTSPLSHIQPALFVMEHAWKLTYYYFEAVYGNQDYLIQTGTQDIQRQIELDRQELNYKVEDVTSKLTLKLEEAQSQIKQLKQTVSRLTQDKERAMALVEDRDLEIKRLRAKREDQPHQLTKFLNQLESNLNQTIEERKLQLDAIGFMADICTVQQGTGKLSPIWEKKRNKLKQEAILSVSEKQPARRMDTPSVASPRVKDSFNRRSPYLQPVPTEQQDLVSLSGISERLAAFYNPYLKKARDGENLESGGDQEGVAPLVQQLFNTLLDDEEQDILKELFDEGKLEPERPGTAASGTFSATDRTYKLLKMEEKLMNFKKISHNIWQHVKFHENELRKAITHEDQELALLLNPIDKGAGMEQSTQTALRLNPRVQVDYTPLAPAMQLKNEKDVGRQKHNPLLVILNTYRHKRAIKQGVGRPTLLPGEIVTAREQGTVLGFLVGAMEERVRGEDRSRSKTEQMLNFCHFFFDHMVITFGLKTQAIKHFHFIYKNLKQLFKVKNVPMAMEILNLLGIGETVLSQDQETLLIKSLLVFKDMALKPPAKSPEPPPATLETMNTEAALFSNALQSDNAYIMKVLEFFESGDVSILEVVERLKRMGISTTGDAQFKQTGLALLENISSDSISYLPKLDKGYQPTTLQTLNTQQTINTEENEGEKTERAGGLGGARDMEDHALNAALAKLEMAEEKQRKPHKRVFEIIDKERKGMITRDQFQQYAREVLQVYWTKEQVGLVNSFFDPQGLDIIDRDTFVSVMGEKRDVLRAYYKISLHGFTLALRKAWKEWKKVQTESLMELFKKYDENQDQVLSLQEFETMLRSIEPSMKTVEVVRLYRETLDMEANAEDIDRMSPEAFCQMAFQYKLGGHGKEFFGEGGAGGVLGVVVA